MRLLRFLFFKCVNWTTAFYTTPNKKEEEKVKDEIVDLNMTIQELKNFAHTLSVR